MTRDQLIAQAAICDEAREEIAEWASYANGYFQEKHHLVEVLAKWQVRARELRAQAKAMPRVAQTVAWMYQHEETGNVNFRPHNERWVDHRRYVEIPLYASPPDLAARVEELEAALRNLLNDTQHSEHHCGDEACPVSIARAVLAKETQ